MKKYSDGKRLKNLGQISEYLGYARTYLYQQKKRNGWPCQLEGSGPWSIEDVEKATCLHIITERPGYTLQGQTIRFLPYALRFMGDDVAAEAFENSKLYQKVTKQGEAK